MELSLTEEQQLLGDTIREIIAATLPLEEIREAVDDGGVPVDESVYLQLVEVGCAGLLVGEEHGGSGGTAHDLVVALEACGHGMIPGSLRGTALAAHFTSRSEATRAHLPALLGGDGRGAVHPVGGTAAGTRIDGGLVLEGTLDLVEEGADATVLVVLVDVDSTPTLLAMPLDVPGVSRSTVETYDPTRRFADVTLSGVQLPPEAVIAEGPDASALGRELVDLHQLCVAAESVGGASRALDIAVDYARSRQQFGQPIGSFQAVKHLLVDVSLAVESARSATWYAGWALADRPPDQQLSLHAAAVLAATAFVQSATACVQVHGGIGFTREVPAHLMVKRAKVAEWLSGETDAHRAEIGRLLADGLPQGW